MDRLVQLVGQLHVEALVVEDERHRPFLIAHFWRDEDDAAEASRARRPLEAALLAQSNRDVRRATGKLVFRAVLYAKVTEHLHGGFDKMYRNQILLGHELSFCSVNHQAVLNRLCSAHHIHESREVLSEVESRSCEAVAGKTDVKERITTARSVD